MRIDEELLQRVASNARLKLSAQERKKFLKELEEVLEAFRKIDEVNVKEVEPAFHPVELKNVFREDRPKKWCWDPLATTTHKQERWFKGPKIV